MQRRRKGRGRGQPDERPQPPRDVGGQDAPQEGAAAAVAPPAQAAKKKPVSVSPEEVGMQFERRFAISSNLPSRPDHGNLGRKIRLISNLFEVKLPGGVVYHYDVEISDKRRVVTATSDVKSKEKKQYRCISTKRNREIINLMLTGHRQFEGIHAAYDGQKNLYTRKPLNISTVLKVEVVLHEDDANPEHPEAGQRLYEVVIKPVTKRDTNSCAISLDPLKELFSGKTRSAPPQEAFMALETVLRHTPCLKYVPVGRNFFYSPSPEELHPLGGGREIWFGYHQSLRLGQWKPLVNIDMTATTFYSKQFVVEFASEILNRNLNDGRPLTRADIIKLKKELRTLRIEVTHLNYPRKYRVLNLTDQPASRLEFTLTINGNTVTKTVANYFQEQYNMRLRYAHLPCLQVAPETKKIYLPIEVCKIVEGQHCRKKLEEKQSAEMIKFTAVPPEKRFREIQNIVKDSNFNNDPTVKDFGMQVMFQPLRLEGRVLEPPSVRYDKNQRITPKDGTWDMRGKQFFRGAQIKSWVLLSYANPQFCRIDKLENFASLLVQIGTAAGIAIERPVTIRQLHPQRDNASDILDQMHKQHKADLAVIVVPPSIKSLYGDIKQAAERILGINTQCVTDKNVVTKCNPALVSNLCQKINAKMGGVNNSLTPGETPPILHKPIIIIGADVTHPGPSHTIKPSIAAAVGSLDAHPSRYAVTCRAQKNIDEKKQSVEIIENLKDMVVDLLKAFYRATGGKKPEKIVFYRDGVSEGQFDVVKEQEVKLIREACMSLSPDYQPGITFIVVQKRHHTRFMPERRADGVGRPGNVPPGTTVDTEVSHPLNFDFFLCSHLGLQGTSRPAHYTVIEDDNQLSSNELQKLTFYLCHTYARCTKSISIPAPVAYAHLAAFRARQHLISQGYETTSASGESEEFHELPSQILEAIKVKEIMKNTMYFV